MRTTRLLATLAATSALWLTTAATALACGFLVAENGAIRLAEFSALAAVADDGTTHYVTSFTFQGSTDSFGALVPLPAEPTTVEKAGAWTLQRLKREVQPPVDEQAGVALAADSAASAEVVATYEVEALDIAILKGGGDAVLDWAQHNGFDLDVGVDGIEDALEMLSFYAGRSPYFAAVRYDLERAEELERVEGDGTPVHFAFDEDAPWVPLRVLTLDKSPGEIVLADIYLLTPQRPRVLTGDLAPTLSGPAGDLLLADLRDDENSAWIPTEAWLTYYDLEVPAGELTYDLAVAAPGSTVVDRADAFGIDDGVVAAPLVDRVTGPGDDDGISVPRALLLTFTAAAVAALLALAAWAIALRRR